MPGKFCPRCGVEGKDVSFYKGFCSKCYREMHGDIKLPRKIILTQCKKCGRIFYKNKWIEDSFQNLRRIFKDKIGKQVFKPRIELEIVQDDIDLNVSGFLDFKEQLSIKASGRVQIKNVHKECNDCYKRSSKYWEAKIQLRLKTKQTNEIIIDRIEEFVKKGIRRHRDERARIFWIEETKEGIDLLFGSRTVADSIIKPLLRKFRLKAETSSKLVGMTRDGKKKVKFTYCIRV